MRHNTGEAPIIVMAACLSVPTRNYNHLLENFAHEVENRVQALLDHPGNGLLRSSVHGSTTATPRFKLEASIDATQVVRTKSHPSVSLSDASLLEDVIRQEHSDASSLFRLEDSLPLWSVSIYHSSQNIASECSSARRAWLALSVHHCISDGKGSQALLNAILYGTIDGMSSDVKVPSGPQQTIPPSSNETLPMDPPLYGLVIPLAMTKFVMPKLAVIIPSFIRRTYTRTPAWPALRSKRDGKPSRREPPVRWLSQMAPQQTHAEMRLVSYDSQDMVDDIKRQGKINGVATIHSTIHAAMIVALAAALKAFGGTDEYVYASETPVDHRSPDELGHGKYTGNYIGVCWWRQQIRRDCSFWELARDYAALVSDETKRRRALVSIGLLKYIKAGPVNISTVPSCSKDMIGAEAATGWEQWWHEKAEGRRPHRVSAGLSNLGVNLLDADVYSPNASQPAIKAHSVAMFQCPSAIGPAIDVDVMGYKRTIASPAEGITAEGGLNLSVSWRAGVFDATIPQSFTEGLAAIGPLISRGIFPPDISVGEAVDLLLPLLPSPASPLGK